MVSKLFRIKERLSVEVRVECFNVSNTPPFLDPSGIFGSPAFGTIIAAGNPRSFQGVLKIHF